MGNNNPYHAANNPPPNPNFIDFNTQRICPACGKAININHNFCKYCGVDLSAIEPIGKDNILNPLATTAVTDPDADVRKEALDTIGSFKDKKALGVLTYVLFNDPDPRCRKEAADELGDLHHPYSLEALTRALKDQSPDVRKEAIEGLKKIKEHTKSKDQKKGKPEERGIETEKLDDFKEKEEAKEEENFKTDEDFTNSF